MANTLSSQSKEKGGAFSARTAIRLAMAQTIVDAAVRVIIQEGHAAFGLRRVAAAAGMSLSTLQYHFPTLDDLMRITVKTFMDKYISGMQSIMRNPSKSPEDTLRKLIAYLIALTRSPDAVVGTLEAWALARRNESVLEILRAGYESYRGIFIGAIRDINPRLSSRELEARATVIGAQIDGLLPYGFEGAPSVRDWKVLERICFKSALAICRA